MLSVTAGTAATLQRAGRQLRRGTRVAACARRALWLTGFGCTALLVAFHAHLFWAQLADGRLSDGALLLRWSLGLVLTGALAALWRVGVPLLWGRRAFVLWVLVAFLHWGHASPVTLTEAGSTSPASITYELPSTLTLLAGGLCLLALLLFLRRELPAPARVRRVSCDRRVGARSAGAISVRCPRAPPRFA